MKGRHRHDPALLTAGAPHVRGRASLRTLTGAFLVALAPCFAFALYNTGYQANLAAELETVGWRAGLLEFLDVGRATESVFACCVHGALYLLPLLAVSLVVGHFWERVFARFRKRELLPGLGLFATLFALSLPPTLPLWQAALGISFGVVVGKEIFGGTGRYVVHPVLVGLAFLTFTFPGEMRVETLLPVGATWTETFLGRIPGTLGETSTLACLVGAAFLIVARAASWRIMLGACLGMVATAYLLGWTSNPALTAAAWPWYWHLTLGSFAFATVFIATDPVSAAMTQTGRWVYGLLIGFLVVLIRVASPIHAEGTTLAILLGNVFAPLIDHGVVRLHVRKRLRRAPVRRGAS